MFCVSVAPEGFETVTFTAGSDASAKPSNITVWVTVTLSRYETPGLVAEFVDGVLTADGT